MNKIKNVSNSEITINLPNVRYRTMIRPKQERPMPDDVFMELNYDPGCTNLVKWGYLSVIYDEQIPKEDRIEVAADTGADVDVKDLLTNKTIKELAEVLKNASPALKDEIVAVAVELSIVDQGRCNIIKNYTDIDVLNVLAMARKE